mmetsp:Transcript_33668/g.66539  ORF Transcript_33668/g.66539 Transcript_33668/m.66539 type:complete len:135 (-) Transcript_33668:1396-1800(-)
MKTHGAPPPAGVFRQWTRAGSFTPIPEPLIGTALRIPKPQIEPEQKCARLPLNDNIPCKKYPPSGFSFTFTGGRRQNATHRFQLDQKIKSGIDRVKGATSTSKGLPVGFLRVPGMKVNSPPKIAPGAVGPLQLW